MKLFEIIPRKKIAYFGVLILVILAACLIFRLITFKTYPIFPFLSFLENSYLLLVEKFSNQLLNSTGSIATLDNHHVVLNNLQLDSFSPEIRFKKWMVLFLFLIWITKTSIRSRAYFTVLLILVHFIVVSIYNAFGAHYIGIENHSISFLAIPVTFGLVCIITIPVIWFRKHKMNLLIRLSKLKINTRYFENDFRVFVIVYIYIIASNFLFVFFDYAPWINFLFTSSQKILAIFGYEAFVEPNLLLGENGSISMARGCLGFQTMFLFAIMVYLTGEGSKYKWIYILAGIVFLNFVNVLRFVFLFIYLQKHEGYDLAMDVHDMYNYITYLIVFVLWVIWFEKFADSRQNPGKPGSF